MRSAVAPFSSPRRQIVRLERQAELGQAIEHALVALVSIGAQLGQRRSSSDGGPARSSEHVHGDAPLEVDLHARDDLRQALTGGERIRRAIHRIVVGHGDSREAAAASSTSSVGVCEPSESDVCVYRSIPPSLTRPPASAA